MYYINLKSGRLSKQSQIPKEIEIVIKTAQLQKEKKERKKERKKKEKGQSESQMVLVHNYTRPSKKR